jgi:hypothetical protein
MTVNRFKNERRDVCGVFGIRVGIRVQKTNAQQISDFTAGYRRAPRNGTAGILPDMKI